METEETLPLLGIDKQKIDKQKARLSLKRELSMATINNPRNTKVMVHKHVMGKDGKVQLVNIIQEQEKWSEKHPRCAKCCCLPYVRWMDKPKISTLAKFSVRWPRLANCLPRRFVNWLDDEGEPATEHFALPEGTNIYVKQGVALGFISISILFFFLSLGLAIWQSADPPPSQNSTDGCFGSKHSHNKTRVFMWG